MALGPESRSGPYVESSTLGDTVGNTTKLAVFGRPFTSERCFLNGTDESKDRWLQPCEGE